jgi:ubiquinone/menaquinone biosynthesis C-methylase UbiE
MESSDIIRSLNKYKSEEFQSDFLDELIQYFQDKGKITKIFENDCMLAGIRLHILYNKYYIYLIPEKPTLKTLCYRQLNLSKNQAYNLKNQIVGFKKNTFHICSDEKANNLTSFLVFSSTSISNARSNEIPLDLALGLIGVHSLAFLEYQNLNNYCKLYNSKVFDNLTVYKKELSTFSWQDRDRILISDDMVYNLLGTTDNENIDLLIVSKDLTSLKDSKDSKVLSSLKDSTLIISKNPELNDLYYRVKWYLNKLPSLVGAPDIYTMLINTKYHFYFMGLKCISIFANVQKAIHHSNYYSFIDIYLLKIINKLDCMNSLCLKNISFDKNVATVYNDENTAKEYDQIISYAKKKYKLDIPASYIKEHFKKCSEKFDTIYKKKAKYYDPLTGEQIGVHRKVSQHYIMKYGRDKENLLDMGSGKLSGAYIYKKARLKHIFGVEPSKYSVETARETAKKFPSVNFTLINGFADKPLNIKGTEHNIDIITFIFTIHYMIDNIDIVLDNIRRASKPGTIIIITCVNGDKVISNIGKSDRHEIRYYNEVYWSVYKFNKNNKYLFYMKDTYGLEMGSEEPLVMVGDLIDKFKKNNIKLIHQNSFKNEYNNIPNAKKLHKFQCEILDIQQLLIFEV